jgi:hypothetical protein
MSSRQPPASSADRATPPAASTKPELTPGPTTLEAYRNNGLMARPVSSEDRAELDAFFAARQQAIHTGQMHLLFAQEDYPVFFQTDDASGKPVTFIMDHERYLEMMSQVGPYFPRVPLQHGPRDYIFLTDTMVIAHQVDTYDFGAEKASWRSANILVKRDGQWKNKGIIEGGFGEFLTANGVLRQEDLVAPKKK